MTPEEALLWYDDNVNINVNEEEWDEWDEAFNVLNKLVEEDDERNNGYVVFQI